MPKITRQDVANKDMEFFVETLEDRKLLAGNVVANITNSGNLVINGDGANNNISVEISEDGFVAITGNDGENIDAGNLEFSRVSGDVRINMRGGDDIVLVDGGGNELPVRNLNLIAGSGNDRVAVQNVASITGNLVINTGSGNDEVYMNYAETSGDLTISSGSGDDYILAGVQAKNITIKSGSGNDVIGLYQSNASEDVLITSSSGDDLVNVGDSSSGLFSPTPRNFTIRTGSGNDNIYINDSKNTGSNFVIASGGGNDNLTMGRSFGDLNINLGGGKDFMFLSDHAGTGTARGGGGFDRFGLLAADDLDLTTERFEDDFSF